MSISTTEAEYVAAAEFAKEAVWLRALLHGLDFAQDSATPMRIDSTSAITLSTDATFHTHVKHIDIKWHSLRKVVAAKSLAVSYVNTYLNVADAFTKPLEHMPFIFLRRPMGAGPSREEESS